MNAISVHVEATRGEGFWEEDSCLSLELKPGARRNNSVAYKNATFEVAKAAAEPPKSVYLFSSLAILTNGSTESDYAGKLQSVRKMIIAYGIWHGPIHARSFALHA